MIDTTSLFAATPNSKKYSKLITLLLYNINYIEINKKTSIYLTKAPLKKNDFSE